jgi:hypothetical protein
MELPVYLFNIYSHIYFQLSFHLIANFSLHYHRNMFNIHAILNNRLTMCYNKYNTTFNYHIPSVSVIQSYSLCLASSLNHHILCSVACILYYFPQVCLLQPPNRHFARRHMFYYIIYHQPCLPATRTSSSSSSSSLEEVVRRMHWGVRVITQSVTCSARTNMFPSQRRPVRRRRSNGCCRIDRDTLRENGVSREWSYQYNTYALVENWSIERSYLYYLANSSILLSIIM